MPPVGKFEKLVTGTIQTIALILTFLKSNIRINTLRTGDADLRFCITTVQDG